MPAAKFPVQEGARLIRHVLCATAACALEASQYRPFRKRPGNATDAQLRAAQKYIKTGAGTS